MGRRLWPASWPAEPSPAPAGSRLGGSPAAWLRHYRESGDSASGGGPCCGRPRRSGQFSIQPGPCAHVDNEVCLHCLQRGGTRCRSWHNERATSVASSLCRRPPVRAKWPSPSNSRNARYATTSGMSGTSLVMAAAPRMAERTVFPAEPLLAAHSPKLPLAIPASPKLQKPCPTIDHQWPWEPRCGSNSIILTELDHSGAKA